MCTILDGVKLESAPPSRWASTRFNSRMVMASYGIATSPLDYMHCLHVDKYTRSLHDALRPNSFDPTNYLPELECPPCDHRPG